MAKKDFSLRLQPENEEKLRILAKKEGRSINGQADFLIMKGIEEYEKINGNLKKEKDKN